MNAPPALLVPTLQSRTKDLLCAVEFYPSTSTSFVPDQAIALFATENVRFSYGTSVPQHVIYYREVFTMPSLSRNLGKQSNSITIRFSNISRRLANFVLNNQIQGMKVVLRVLSRANLQNAGSYALSDCSFVAYVGKCQKEDGFDRGIGSITAKQDLGQIEAQIPPRIFQKTCPLKFKGAECLGTELITDKTATYQAATVCNKTITQCDQYSNTKFFQGIRVEQIPGSFIYKAHQGFFAKLFHIASFGLLFKRRVVTVDNSLEDGTPYGKTIPMIFGRWQASGVALQYQDIGTSINWLMAWCRGPISAILNIRNNTVGFTQPLGVTNHLGEYGGQGSQTADTVFPEHGFFSRLAYSTGYVNGSQVDVQDAAPEISSMIAGVSPVRCDSGDAFNRCGAGRITGGGIGYGILGPQWIDNPADLTRFVLEEPALLGLSTNQLDLSAVTVTSWYCAGAIRDDTNAERLLLPNTESGKAGVDYHRYNTTGLITKDSWPVTTGQFPKASASHEAKYEFYDPASPPAPSSITVKTFYRKRYTANIIVNDQKKVIDFLFDTLLPSFRGFLTWNNLGQIKILSERPADSVLLRTSASIGATTLELLDVIPWKIDVHDSPTLQQGKILVGVSLSTSEVRGVTAAVYSTVANAITLAASASGGPTATASGATLTGGTTSLQASGSIQIGGTLTAGSSVTATIDGISVTYTLEGGENNATVASALAFAINADPTLRRYVEANDGGWSDTLTILSKFGTVTLSSALAQNHSAAEETIRVVMSFAGKALTYADTTQANILDGTFKYLGANGQTRYNQFKGTFHDPLRDFAEQPVIVDDYTNQESVDTITPLEIDLSAVDNYNQASRLLNGAAVKYGDGLRFYSWASNGMALQLEEGDVVCVSDDSGSWRNVPVRIEQVTWNEKYEASFTARIYSSNMFDDTVIQTDIPLSSGLVNFASAPPSIAFNSPDFPPDGLVQSTDGAGGITSIRGGAIFGASIYPQFAYVRLIRRAGIVTNEQVAIIHPDSNNKAIFEFVASAAGLYTVELEVCNQWGCNTIKPQASLAINLGGTVGKFIFADDALNLWNDAIALREGELESFADSIANWNDSLASSGGHVEPFSDTLNNWSDAIKIVEGQRELFSENINNWGDSIVAGDVAGAILDLEADTLVLNDNDPVATWADQSGNGNDATQSTSTKKPTYKATGGPGSRPCVNFDGTTDILVLTNTITSSPVTIFAVVKPNTVATPQTLIAGAGSGGLQYRLDNSTREELLKGGITSIGNSTSVTNGAFQQVCVTWDGTNWHFYVGGVSNGSGTNTQTTTGLTRIGGKDDESELFNSSICMLKVYPSVLSSGDIATETAAILARWGV